MFQFGKNRYRPQHSTSTRRSTMAQEACTNKNVYASTNEQQVRDAINRGMDACLTQTGTYHPFDTYSYHDPVGSYQIIVSRCSTSTGFATCSQYYGPLGHWYCFIGYSQGTLFCLETDPYYP